MYLGLRTNSCYDEEVSDSLEPIIAQIKEGRLQGLDDTELEQQLLLGNWSEQELQAGRNFLHFTQSAPLLNEPMAKDVMHKEETFRRREVQKKIIIHWVLPIGVIGCLSILASLMLNYFLFSHATNKTTPPVVVSSVVATTTTQAPSTFCSRAAHFFGICNQSVEL